MEHLFAALSISSLDVQAHIYAKPELFKQAFALVAQAGQKSVVLSLSPKARHMGLYPGANEWRAQRRHPDVSFLAYESSYVQNLWSQIVGALEDLTPRCVVIQKGLLVLDLSGMQRLLKGGERGFALQVQKILDQFPHLDYRLVLAPLMGSAVILAKHFSSVGAPFFPNKLNFAVGEPHELEKVSVHLVVGLTKATREKLKAYQIKTLGEVQVLSLGFLRDHFEKEGELLWLVAQGRSYGKLKSSQAKVIDSSKSRTSKIEVMRNFDQDLQDLQVLEDVIYDLIDELAFELRLQNYWTRHIRIEVIYSDQKFHKENFTLPKLTNQFVEIHSLIKVRVPSLLARRVSVRSFQATASRCIDSGGQEDLFEQASSNPTIAIQEALDVIRNKHGFAKIGNPQAAPK